MITLHVDIEIVPFGTVTIANQVRFDEVNAGTLVERRPIYELPAETMRVEPYVFASDDVEVL